MWKWSQPPPPFRSFHQVSTPELESYVQDLLKAGAIETTSSLSFQGPLFSVPKKGTDKRRVILDLSILNKSIDCPSFKMTTISNVRRILPPNARSYPSVVQEVSRFPDRETKISVSGSSFRPQYRSQSLHQALQGDIDGSSG